MAKNRGPKTRQPVVLPKGRMSILENGKTVSVRALRLGRSRGTVIVAKKEHYPRQIPEMELARLFGMRRELDEMWRAPFSARNYDRMRYIEGELLKYKPPNPMTITNTFGVPLKSLRVEVPKASQSQKPSIVQRRKQRRESVILRARQMLSKGIKPSRVARMLMDKGFGNIPLSKVRGRSVWRLTKR